MQQQQAQPISGLLMDFLRENNLEQQFLEGKIIEVWPAVLGSSVVRYTGEMNIRDGVLFVHIKSAPLRQELFNCRYQLVERLNQAIGLAPGDTSVLRDIRLLG